MIWSGTQPSSSQLATLTGCGSFTTYGATCESGVLRITVGVPHQGIPAVWPGLQHTVCIVKKTLLLAVPPSRRDSNVGEEDFGVLFKANPVQMVAEENRPHHRQVVQITC